MAVREGAALRLNVTVTGSPAPEVRWRRNDELVPADSALTPGPGQLVIPSLTREDAGKWTVVATSPAGRAQRSFKLNVVCELIRVCVTENVLPTVSVQL